MFVNEKGTCSLIFTAFGPSTFSLPMSQWARDAHKLFLPYFSCCLSSGILVPCCGGQAHDRTTALHWKHSGSGCVAFSVNSRTSPASAGTDPSGASTWGGSGALLQPRGSVCGCASVKGKRWRQFRAECSWFLSEEAANETCSYPAAGPGRAASGSRPSVLPCVN